MRTGNTTKPPQGGVGSRKGMGGMERPKTGWSLWVVAAVRDVENYAFWSPHWGSGRGEWNHAPDLARFFCSEEDARKIADHVVREDLQPLGTKVVVIEYAVVVSQKTEQRKGR